MNTPGTDMPKTRLERILDAIERGGNIQHRDHDDAPWCPLDQAAT